MNPRSLRFKINLAIVVTFLVIAALFSAILVYFEIDRRANATSQIENTLQDLLHRNKEVLGNELVAEHDRAIQVTLENMRSREGVVAVTVYDWDGATFASTNEQSPRDLSEAEVEQLTRASGFQRETREDIPVLSYRAPIRAYGEDVGYCSIQFSLQALERESRIIIALFAGLLLTLFAIMCSLLNILMSRTVLRPLHVLQSVMQRVHQNETSGNGPRTGISRALDSMADDLACSQATTESSKEISSLSRSFGGMITALRTAYTDIRQAEMKFRGIFENAHEGIFQMHPDGRMMSANVSMAKLFGHGGPQEFEAAISDFATQCFKTPEDLAEIIQSIERMGSVSGRETELVRRGGETFFGSIAARAVTSVDGGLLYYEGTVVDMTERLEKERAQTEREAAEAAARARSEFLDNSGQGFLSFGPDMVVDAEFSRECETIFKSRDIGGQHIQSLLYPGDERAQDNFTKNVGRILGATDSFRQEMFLSLMPREFAIGPTHVEAEYRPLSAQKMMLVLTDVTHERELEDAVDMERRRLAFIVSVVKNRDEFFDVLDDFERFMADPSAGCENNSVNESYRRVHTYKGLFALLDCIHLPSVLHDAESRLAAMREEAGDHGSIQTEALLPGSVLATFRTAIADDLAMLRQALGEEYLESRGAVPVPADKAADLERLAQKLEVRFGDKLDQETRELLRALRSLRHVDIRTLLETYPRMSLQMAERLGKEIEPFGVEGDAVLVPPETYAPFTRTLVHVFRNAVDHGVEPPEERLEAGKDETAHIRCRVKNHTDAIELVVEDDGRGFDVDALKERARECGLPVDLIDSDDPSSLVFADGVSTTEETNEYSGRGVGLSAVKSKLDSLGGSVEIETSPGHGTRLRFTLPIRTTTQGANHGPES